MSKALTPISVKQMKPTLATKGKHKGQFIRREICDSKSTGLYLHVQPSGKKSWVMLLKRPFKVPNKNGHLKAKMEKLRLGPVDLSERKPKSDLPKGAPLTLAEARILAANVQLKQANEIDVIAEHRAEKIVREIKAEGRDVRLFPAVARQFIDEHARPHTRRWLETARSLGFDFKDDDSDPVRRKGGLAERWREREIKSITSDNVRDLINESKRHGIPGIPPTRNTGLSNSRGRAMARVLSKFFDWALDERKITTSPSKEVKAPKAPDQRNRTLDRAELILFWRATDELNKTSEPFGSILKLLLLTGARLKEVSEMRLAELGDGVVTLPDDREIKTRLWTIPPPRTKNKREFLVPLPQQACDILDGVKSPKSKSGYIFTTTGHSPVSGFSKIKKRLDELMLAAAEKDGLKIEPWRIHDLRRTCATMMAESPPNGLGIPPHVVEACLNHVSGHQGGVAGRYNKATYLTEKLVAFKRWADHVDVMVSDRRASNVTPLHRRKKGKRSGG